MAGLASKTTIISDPMDLENLILWSFLTMAFAGKDSVEFFDLLSPQASNIYRQRGLSVISTSEVPNEAI